MSFGFALRSLAVAVRLAGTGATRRGAPAREQEAWRSLRAGRFVVPGLWGWGFVPVLYAVVEMEVGCSSEALVVEAG